jgi:hypothetical protein
MTDTAILPEPVSPQTPPPSDGAAAHHGRVQRLPLRVRDIGVHRPVLGLLLLAAFGLRIWGIRQGLPYSYNSDEASHFVPRAVAFFSHDLNPHYFLNPPAYSYLLHIVFELWFGNGDRAARLYATDPTTVFVVARLVAAALGTAAVGFTYLAGARLFNRAAGLLAAAVMAVAFLPVFYSHLALNDVPTLAPVALSLYGSAGVMRRGRRRDYLIAGVAGGLAAATKYTGGIVLVCLLAAALQDASGGSVMQSARRLGLAGLVALGAFVLANPYSVLSFHEFISGVSQQASESAGADPVKLGSNPGSGTAYYVWTLTWGFGWVPALAALGGGVLLLVRRRIGMALLLIPAPIVFVIFMGDQQRFFGRWLMPIFPILALLAAYGAHEAVRAAVRRGWPVPLAAGLATVLLLAQGTVAAVHNDAVLSRPDTRNVLRAWMVKHIAPGSKVVVEPLVPNTWTSDIGRSLPFTPYGQRWSQWPTWLSTIGPDGQPLPDGQVRYVVVDQYERVLRPDLLDRYVASGYCWVVIGSLQAGRAFAQPNAAPQAVAYYTQLAERADRAFYISPFAPGADPIPFSFDWSIDYYPRQFRLPGPELSVYHLRGCPSSRPATPG